MPSKKEVKAKLCIEKATHYPLRNFVAWAEHQHCREMLRHLEQIQKELREEDHAWRAATIHGTPEEKARVSRWYFYCTQVKAYYEGLVLGN